MSPNSRSSATGPAKPYSFTSVLGCGFVWLRYDGTIVMQADFEKEPSEAEWLKWIKITNNPKCKIDMISVGCCFSSQYAQQLSCALL